MTCFISKETYNLSLDRYMLLLFNDSTGGFYEYK